MTKFLKQILIGVTLVAIVGVSVYFGTRESNSNKLPSQGECGIQIVKPTNVENASSISWSRVINGDTAINNSWPWMVSYFIKLQKYFFIKLHFFKGKHSFAFHSDSLLFGLSCLQALHSYYSSLFQLIQRQSTR